jgi:hypothetical protein
MKMISIDVRSSGVETVWGEKGGNAVSASQKEKEKICLEVPTKILIYSLVTNLIFDLFITTITVTLSHYPTMSVTDETKAGGLEYFFCHHSIVVDGDIRVLLAGIR